MHMSYPMLPRQPPTPGIQRVDNHQGNAYQGLSDMMHYGLSHFVGRGLPTIWSSINSDVPDNPSVQTSFTKQDSEVIRVWARKIDDWLVRYNGSSRKLSSCGLYSGEVISNYDFFQNHPHRIDRVL